MAIRMTGLVSGMDTESIITELMKAQRLKSTKIENKITTLEWTEDKWKDLNTKIYALYTDSLSKMRLQSSFNAKAATSSDSDKADIVAGNNATTGTHTLQVKELASSQFVTSEKLDTDINGEEITTSTKLTDLGFSDSEGTTITIEAGDTTVNLDIEASTTVGDFTTALSNAGLNASYDTTQKRFFISSKDSGIENAYSITTSSAVTNDLSLLGLNEIVKNADGTVTESGTAEMTLVEASDATIIYNGAELTGNSNDFVVNGLTITLKGVTAGLDTVDTSDDETISLTVTNDTQAVYDTIKDFITEYNELLQEMTDAYGADSARGYDPLTDEEKDAMTETQIEDWETKIQDSLLRRDSTLNSLISSMRTTLSQSVEIDGENYSLASFGVGTVDYTEKGLLHINGDEDDSQVSALTNKLMNALNEDPDTVMMVFNELAGNLYETMGDKMKTSSLSSALTFYNNKEIQNNIDDYQDDLDEWEDRLTEMEDRYYAQFTAMETAMAKLNAQSSSLASLMGTSSS